MNNITAVPSIFNSIGTAINASSFVAANENAIPPTRKVLVLLYTRRRIPTEERVCQSKGVIKKIL
tara:strand:- start:242 stop:436 length:195 start_codon:yes stop_codon:yes gene_type:complete